MTIPSLLVAVLLRATVTLPIARDYGLAFLIGAIVGSATIYTPIPGPIMALAFFALILRLLMAAYDAREGGRNG